MRPANFTENKKLPERMDPKDKIVSLKIWIILSISITLLVILLIIAAGDKKYDEEDDTLTNSVQTESVVVKNCNENIDCFITESEKCNPSKLTHKEGLEILGMIIETEIYYKTEEVSDRCELDIKIINYSVDFSQEYKNNLLSQNMSEEEINSQIENANQYNEYFIGKEGKCKFDNNSDLTDILKKIRDGTLSSDVSCNLEGNCEGTSNWDIADCEGDYFSNQL